MEFVNGKDYPIYEMENRKNVPNHQPNMHVYQRLTCIYTNINMAKYFSEWIIKYLHIIHNDRLCTLNHTNTRAHMNDYECVYIYISYIIYHFLYLYYIYIYCTYVCLSSFGNGAWPNQAGKKNVKICQTTPPQGQRLRFRKTQPGCTATAGKPTIWEWMCMA